MDHSDTVNAVLTDSDAVCECGADPRFQVGDLDGWYIDIIQTPDAAIAQVVCPDCLSPTAPVRRATAYAIRATLRGMEGM